MSHNEEIDLGGFVSSRRASQITGYTQDYIGQLARGAQIDARRISGLWYVSVESLNAYKEKLRDFKPSPPIHGRYAHDSESIVTFDGKEYISASRASKLTGYHQDYIGQLARSGKIMSRQVGNRWYVDKSALVAHQEEKNALLAAVQTQSVGITDTNTHTSKMPQESHATDDSLLVYTQDTADLLPVLAVKKYSRDGGYVFDDSTYEQEHAVPIRIIGDRRGRVITDNSIIKQDTKKNTHRKTVVIPVQTMYRGVYPVLVLTVIVVLSVGMVSLKQNARYTMSTTFSSLMNQTYDLTLVANATLAITSLLDRIEQALSTELVYQKTK